MDKLSAVLISAICLLVCVSTAVVYVTWFADGDEAVTVSALEQIEEEMTLSNIAMNDDAQVINGGCQDMWMRVKVEDPEGETAEEAGYELVSDTIATNPDKADREEGVWTLESDGYYYYSCPVGPGEQSKSLFQSVKAQKEKNELADSSVKAKAEAVQVNWISKKVETGKQAFSLFKMYQPIQEFKGKFV